MISLKTRQAGLLCALLLIGAALSQATAQPRARPASPPARITGGYVLSHEHPTQGMAFGGNYAFGGAPGNFRNGIMEKGYTVECGGCKAATACDHGEFKGNLIAASGSLGFDMGDHPSHKGPVHNSFSHLRYATDWIRDAFAPPEAEYQDTRMKIMVAFAVENEAMCEQLYYSNKGNGGPGGAGYPCSRGDSLESLERQINAIKAWVKENSSWMEIAYSASDARRIVNANKLAIILGIESEYSFGAEDRKFDPVTRLNRYYDMGVRTFYLAHKINSRLAGADIYWPKDTSPGKAIRATQAISGCFYYDDNVGPFPLKNQLGHNFCDNNCGDNHFKGNKLLGLSDACASKLSEISEVNMADYVSQRGDNIFNGFKIYPLPPGFKGKSGSWEDDRKIERNNLSLSHDGERVVREAMLKGMIVNIDQVSSETRKAMDVISKEFGGYPLNALHNNPNKMLVGNKGSLDTPFPHEYDFDDGELEIVRKSGGFFGVRVGPLDSAEYDASGIKLNCPKTSTETAKVLAYLMDQGLTVGYGLDFATITQAVHSRTLRNCGRDLGPDQLHMSGSEIAEGLTHVGMMKKWHKELETIGLKSTYLNKLKNDGAEAFVAMWEKSAAKSTVGKQIPRQTFESPSGGGKKCAEDSDCAETEFCTAGIADLKENVCKAKKSKGETCSTQRQCESDRCSAGFCAEAHECQSDAGCEKGEFCGDPISGRRTCKALKAHGQGCTKDLQCATNRCAWGFCADADECRADADCAGSQYCGDPISGKRSCKALKAHGQGCTNDGQCATNRCAWGFCADANECRADADCTSSQYCGDPISGKRSCKALKVRGEGCTQDSQCATERCAWGFCAEKDECRSDADCTGSQYCGDPISGRRSCKTLKAKGEGCTSDSQCSTNRCAWGFCAEPDECRSNSDCKSSQYCGDPIAGKSKCKDLHSKGESCTKGAQCKSGKCSIFRCQ
jgi:microsomal dipeptidase-like Zn-dependent dipeptidase